MHNKTDDADKNQQNSNASCCTNSEAFLRIKKGTGINRQGEIFSINATHF